VSLPQASPDRAGGAGSPPQAWFCLKVQSKHEHIAEAHLAQKGLEVFNPRIRFRRTTRQAQVWVTEALFPGYVFARLDVNLNLGAIRYLPGVRDIVHFGRRWPAIPDEAIAELQKAIGPEKVHEVPTDLAAGDSVKIAGGVFHGLDAVISRVLPARERVLILLNFLGRQATVEIGAEKLIKDEPERAFLRPQS
jgi:transcriptional antiterminator RfaH